METDSKAEEINHLQALIAAEEEKEKLFKAENIRRRHNYIPFIVELMKMLAKEGKLVPLVQQVCFSSCAFGVLGTAVFVVEWRFFLPGGALV